MKSLDDIRTQLSDGRFEFTRHAFRRAIERNVSEAEIKQAGKHAEVIEEYPEDKYSPSVLLLGFTDNKRPLHLQVSSAESDPVKIITRYEPDSSEWADNFSKRRQDE